MLQDFIAYLNDNSGALTVLVTFVYVVATIFICRANILAAQASQKQLAEMKKQYAQENRPNVEVEFLYENRAFYGLRFINHGKYTAQKVAIELDQGFINSLDEKPFQQQLDQLKGKTCVIGVGQHYDVFFGTERYRSNPNKVAAKGCIRYEGNGCTYESNFEIDLESYSAIFSVTTEQEQLRNKIEKQCSALKGIQKELHELNAQIRKKNSDEMENKE